jgi:hypothetical protein
VRKNRITTVTISPLERPPCQCRNTAVSEPSAVRSCIGLTFPRMASTPTDYSNFIVAGRVGRP